MRPLKGQGFCWNHSPSVAAKRARARKAGGRNSRTRVPPVLVTTIRDLQDVIGSELAAVSKLAGTNRRANAVARLVTVAVRLIECGAHEERMEAIEERLKGMEARR